MSLKKIVQQQKFFDLYSLFIPLTFVFITTRFKILNPRTDGWLSAGDGTIEIAWEFFRNTPFPLWLIGNLDSYGQEMARPAFYLLPTLYAWPLRFFSFILGERFQFIGLIILLNLILHYFISTKIFKVLGFSNIQNIFASTLLLTAPILHLRYIDESHYVLSSNWILLFLIYLILKRDTSWLKWSLLIISSVLIFPYYVVFVFLTASIFFIRQIRENLISLKQLTILFISSLISITFAAIISGYIFFGNVLEKDTELIFAANLNTLIDPSGWSRLIKDRPQSDGNYEGFAFLGLNFIILVIIVGLIVLKNSITKKTQFNEFSKSFFILFIAAMLLALISLSRVIYFDDNKIIDIDANWIYSLLELNFRSLGRFVWLLVYLIMIYTIYKLQSNIKPQLLNWILFFAIFLGLFDTWPKLTSQVNEKFSIAYENPLNSKFWGRLSTCYDTFVSVPSVTTAKYLFPIAKIASPQNMNLYPAYVPRVSPSENFLMQVGTSQQIKFGKFDSKSIYVFQEAQYVLESIVEQDKIIALNTMPEGSRAGLIDGVFVVAPNFENCEKLYEKYADKLDLNKQYSYQIEDSVNFSNNVSAANYLITGWSEIETDGVWSIEENAGVLIQRDNLTQISSIKISGNRFNLESNSSPELEIRINGQSKIILKDYSNQNSFIVPLSAVESQQNNFYIEFRFKNLKTPREISGLDDDRKLGFQLKSISYLQ